MVFLRQSVGEERDENLPSLKGHTEFQEDVLHAVLTFPWFAQSRTSMLAAVGATSLLRTSVWVPLRITSVITVCPGLALGDGILAGSLLVLKV